MNYQEVYKIITIDRTYEQPYVKFSNITMSNINIHITGKYDSHPRQVFLSNLAIEVMAAQLKNYDSLNVVINMESTCYLHFLDCMKVIEKLLEGKKVNMMILDLRSNMISDFPEDIKKSMIDKIKTFSKQKIHIFKVNS